MLGVCQYFRSFELTWFKLELTVSMDAGLGNIHQTKIGATKMFNISRFLIFIIMCLGLGGNAWAQNSAGCETSVTVQPGDTLSSIARARYGATSAYTKIVRATNAQATTDSSFANIADPNRIEPGWKLCLPGIAGQAPVASQPSIITQAPQQAPSPDVTRITFLQINDVYEMSPVGGEGGVARLATLRQRLLAANPNTFTILSGDLFSPSALGTAKVDGERLAGKQMVAAMNAFGLDYATFGNHEFDIKEAQFRKRMEETETQWFSSNVFEADGTSFPGTPQNIIFSVTGGDGQDVTVGMFGLTLDSNPVSYVSYTDPFEAAAAHISALKDHVDILVAVTHLSMARDMQLAERFPELDLIIGGHEHENALKWHGANSIPITKADANARTAYVIDIDFNRGTKQVKITPRLEAIDASIPDDPEVAKVVEFWQNKAYEGFKQQGFDPAKRITVISDALDGTEASVRTRPTKLTQLIADSMRSNAPGTDVAIFNGGSIRIDDTIAAGAITEYDVIRVLPFGGDIISVEMTGSLLQKTLDQGAKNIGIGSYLQTAGVTGNQGAWLINGKPLDPGAKYGVAINDFLLTGKEQNLGFLKAGNPEMQQKDTHDDLRKALIAELLKTYGRK